MLGQRKQVANQAVATRATESMVGKLAQFFDGAMPVHIPVNVTVLRTTRNEDGQSSGPKPLSETTVIEFGTAREVLFASSLPLEFEDRVHLTNADGSLDAQASVVAVQYQQGQIAVAARFAGEIANWIIKQ